MALVQLICQFLLVKYTTSLLHPNVGLGPVELASRYGFPLEIHKVITEDGYILTIHRISHGKNNNCQELGQPALLLHGLFSSSVDWMNLGETTALSFLLAEKGYDVWMGNARGNTFSRKHITLDPDFNKSQFWDFSWHEIGYFDVPAILELILSKTKFKTVQFVAFSQGSTAFLVMASTRPEYMAKIKFAHLMAPAYTMAHLRSPLLRMLASFTHGIYNMGHFWGIHELFKWSEYYSMMWMQLCDEGKSLEQLCRAVMRNVVGSDGHRIERDFIPVLLSNFPAGSSLNQFAHFGQSSSTNQFRQFDYGNVINLQKYGTKEPPTYDVRRITSPIAVYYSIADNVVDMEDSQRLVKDLSNVVLFKSYNCSHDKFVYSTTFVKLINNDIIQNMAKYN